MLSFITTRITTTLLFTVHILQHLHLTHAEDTSIHPFTINIPDATIKDTWRRLADARYPVKLSGNDPVDWSRGTEPSYLKQFVDYWRTEYNWTDRQAKLNQFSQFTTTIDDLSVHFIHHKSVDSSAASQGKVVPLMMLSGWSSTAHECTRVLPLLTAKHPNVTFDVVCPNLPGYAFSQPPRDRSFECRAMAGVMNKLMIRLGYDQYIVHGNDWGAAVATQMAQWHSDHVSALHTCMTPVVAPWMNKGIRGLISAVAMTFMPSLVLTAEEREYVDKQLAEVVKGAGYFHEVATDVYTITSALEQSPVALAAYTVEKYRRFSDPERGFEKNMSKDDMIDTLMMYWVTNSITTSGRLYYEQFNIPGVPLTEIFFTIDVKVPTGVAQFKYEIPTWKAPKHILQYYYNVQHFTTYPFGGHYPTTEAPQTLADDIRAFVSESTELGRKAVAASSQTGTGNKHSEL